jgi:hypothetical protein
MHRLLISMILGIALLLVASRFDAEQTLAMQALDPSGLAYHDHLPSEPLPPTLDPSELREDRASYVAYTLAGRVRSTLYQVPCHCPCRKLQGHGSLLDCFVGRHGIGCPTCQKEAIFCFSKTRQGTKPSAIRDAIAQGEAWKIDIAKETEKLFAEWAATNEKK